MYKVINDVPYIGHIIGFFSHATRRYQFSIEFSTSEGENIVQSFEMIKNQPLSISSPKPELTCTISAAMVSNAPFLPIGYVHSGMGACSLSEAVRSCEDAESRSLHGQCGRGLT